MNRLERFLAALFSHPLHSGAKREETLAAADAYYLRLERHCAPYRLRAAARVRPPLG